MYAFRAPRVDLQEISQALGGSVGEIDDAQVMDELHAIEQAEIQVMLPEAPSGEHVSEKAQYEDTGAIDLEKELPEAPLPKGRILRMPQSYLKHPSQQRNL